jgi:hypothetical protein
MLDPNRIEQAAAAMQGICDLAQVPAGDTALFLLLERSQVLNPSQKQQLEALLKEFKHPILTNPAVKAAQLTNEYKVVADLEHGKFELRLGTDSALEWKITYKDVEPDKTEEKARLLAAELNEKLEEKVAALPYKAQMPKGWKVYLAERCKMPGVNTTQDLVVEGTTLIDDSFNRHRTQTVTVNREDRISHNEFLSNRGQTFVDNHSTLIAIAFFRYFGGFPIALELIGTIEDTGDLAQGKGVRTEIEGSSAGSAVSRPHGGYINVSFDDAIALAHVGVFGRPPRRSVSPGYDGSPSPWRFAQWRNDKPY